MNLKMMKYFIYAIAAIHLDVQLPWGRDRI